MDFVIFELEQWESTAFASLERKESVRYVDEPLTPENAEKFAEAEVISTFIYSDLSRAVLERLEKLKFIATRSTGFDHIDLGYCNDKGIAVANVPSYGQNTVAEHVFGLLLTISHNLNEAINRTRKGDFSLQGLRGFDLKGKTFGVIGTGHIGRCAIRIARGFEMDVLAFDVMPDEEAAKQEGFRYVDRNELFKNSDVISLHVPANKQTEDLISKPEFEMMKKGAVLINTSRGTVVNVNALIEALAEKKIAAAGLDVLPEEPVIREEAELLRSVYHKKYNTETLLADHVLLRLRNVFITPHSAFDTVEAQKRILDTTVENIWKFLDGELKNVVNESSIREPAGR